MIRYRCPHCAALTAAHERRIGQLSVCKACVKAHSIPSDKSLWLNEAGELLFPPESEPETPVEAPPEETPPEQVVPAPTAPALELSPEPEASQQHHPSEQPEPEPRATVPPEDDPLEEVPPEQVVLTPTVTALELPPEPEVSRQHHPSEQPEPVENTTPSAPTQPNLTLREPVIVSVSPATVPPPPTQPDTELHEPETAKPTPQVQPQPSIQPVPAPEVKPVQLQTQTDIAVALTTALANRLKPPPAPRRDLRPSTAIWLLLTAGGLAFVLLALFSRDFYRWPALVIGIVQILSGYVWIILLTHARDPNRGLLCAIPPLTFSYLVQVKYAKLRPLRFVATGIALVVLAALVPALSPHSHAIFQRKVPPDELQPDPATMSKLEQLRYYTERKDYASLGQLLDVLAKTDPLLSQDAKDRAAISAELKLLCQHPLTQVRVQATDAYSRWDPAGARLVCLAAVKSTSEDERKAALRSLPQWKDGETARAVQSLIGRTNSVETNLAKAALEDIGGVHAEQAALELFDQAEDQATKLTALLILRKVGSAKAVEPLRARARASGDVAIQTEALATADAIEVRTSVSSPAPKPSP